MMAGKITYFATNVPELEMLDFPLLEKAAGVQFNEGQQQRVLARINSYLRDSTVWKEAPGAAKVKEDLKKISRHGAALAALLSGSCHKGQAALNLCWPSYKKAEPEQVQLLLYELAANAKACARDISPSRGNPGNLALRQFISELHEIWRQAGGTGIGANWNNYVAGGGAGPFLSFLQLILEQAGESHGSAALLSAIQSALKA